MLPRVTLGGKRTNGEVSSSIEGGSGIIGSSIQNMLSLSSRESVDVDQNNKTLPNTPEDNIENCSSQEYGLISKPRKTDIKAIFVDESQGPFEMRPPRHLKLHTFSSGELVEEEEKKTPRPTK